MSSVLLIGGTSEIGLAIVRRLAADRGLAPWLLGRDEARMREAWPDAAGVVVHNARAAARADAAISEAFRRAGGRIDVVVHAVGVLGAQAGIDADPAETHEVMLTGFAGAGALLIAALRELASQGSGTLVVLSSVAAERARAGNAIYGATKAGLDSLAQGLGDQARERNVRVVVVRPGFVRTRMTAGLEPTPFATTAEAVADATLAALDRPRVHTVWVPGVLRYVFMVLRHVPRPLYRRLPL